MLTMLSKNGSMVVYAEPSPYFYFYFYCTFWYFTRVVGPFSMVKIYECVRPFAFRASHMKFLPQHCSLTSGYI